MSKTIPTLALALLSTLAACGGASDPAGAPAGPAQLAAAQSAAQAAAQSTAQSAYSAAALAAPPVSEPQQSIRTAASSVAAAVPPAARRAMWSWYDADIGTSARQRAMLDFATDQRVSVIYLHSESLLTRQPALLAGFLNRAAAYGVTVELLFGASEWMLSANHQYALDLVAKSNAFVAGLTGARPAGLHFDIEPHSLPNWKTDQVAMGQQLIDLYQKLARAKAAGLYLHADIALGYEYLTLTRGGVSKTLSQWLIDSTDRVTVMSYRDVALGADGIVAHAAHPIAYAGTLGKLAVAGVETACNAELPKVTFCEEGRLALEGQLGSVGAYFGGAAGFGGVAIHDYRNFKVLR
ncbi:hypothetical protein ACFDR9_002879 [Janthinobacterium sp. CG_23.3]|uniref:hypothetical protein n=1 Tax=Janthinobacterium sp. CG_23.3 TaxID=3349634 RepID=UPI0038D3FF95